jgi:hypothetical protein
MTQPKNPDPSTKRKISDFRIEVASANLRRRHGEGAWRTDHDTRRRQAADSATGASVKKRLPRTPAEWLKEIRLAYQDASEAQAFAPFVGTTIGEADLYHLAPLACLKFRGLDLKDEKLRDRVTKGALANYVANVDRAEVGHGLKASPVLAFALCYVTAHLVLDLIDEQKAESILTRCELHLDEHGTS